MHIQRPSKSGGGERGEGTHISSLNFKSVVLHIEEAAMSLLVLNYCICDFPHCCRSFILHVTISFVFSHYFKAMSHVGILPKHWASIQ